MPTVRFDKSGEPWGLLTENWFCRFFFFFLSLVRLLRRLIETSLGKTISLGKKCKPIFPTQYKVPYNLNINSELANTLNNITRFMIISHNWKTWHSLSLILFCFHNFLKPVMYWVSSCLTCMPIERQPDWESCHVLLNVFVLLLFKIWFNRFLLKPSLVPRYLTKPYWYPHKILIKRETMISSID